MARIDATAFLVQGWTRSQYCSRWCRVLDPCVDQICGRTRIWTSDENNKLLDAVKLQLLRWFLAERKVNAVAGGGCIWTLVVEQLGRKNRTLSAHRLLWDRIIPPLDASRVLVFVGDIISMLFRQNKCGEYSALYEQIVLAF